MRDGIERTREEAGIRVGVAELAEGTEVTAETEPGKGEPHCGYGVEVVGLLEMEPVGRSGRSIRRRLPWKKYASVAFIIVFILGILNAGASLYLRSMVVSPADIVGTRGCELSGEVLDIAGKPIPNATVVVTDTTMSAFTNKDGWFVIKGIRPGSHRVEAAAEGYNTMSVRTDMFPEMLNIIDFTLEKGGADVSVDESAAPDFGQPGSSYIWGVPVLVLSSVCALAAAILSLGRKDRWHTTVVLGAIGLLSFGFGAGSALAMAGIAMTAIALPEEGPLPQKKLRVGLSYPSKRPAAKRAAGRAGAIPEGRPSRPSEAVLGGPILKPVPKAENSPPSLVQVPAAEGAVPEPPPVPAAEPAGEAIAPARPGPLKDRTADGELEPMATAPVKQAAGGPAPPSRPRKLVRRSTKGKILCYTCVEEIAPGSVYIRCTCGRSVHSSCLAEARCPCCGEAFGRAAA